MARRGSTAGRRPATRTRSSSGLDPQLTYLKIAAAADCVRAGAVLVATNKDPMYPTERGFRPGRRVGRGGDRGRGADDARVTIGKPGPHLLEAGARLVGADLSRAVMIGDALTDVQAGKAVGARTVLMLTGVTTRAIADALPEPERPTRIAEDGAALARDPRGARGRLSRRNTASRARASACRDQLVRRALPFLAACLALFVGGLLAAARRRSRRPRRPRRPADPPAGAARCPRRPAIADLAAERWASAGIDDYVGRLQIGCECGLQRRVHDQGRRWAGPTEIDWPRPAD